MNDLQGKVGLDYKMDLHCFNFFVGQRVGPSGIRLRVRGKRRGAVSELSFSSRVILRSRCLWLSVLVVCAKDLISVCLSSCLRWSRPARN